MDRAMKRLRILVLMHPDCVPPDSTDGYTAREINGWKTEFDVVSTLRAAGHDVRPLGVQEEIRPVRDEIESFKPHVVYQLLEEFHYGTAYDQHIASYLELMKIPYTGCNPRGREGSVQNVGAPSPDRGTGLCRVSDAPQGQPALAPCPAAGRQEPERGWILRYLASIHRRYGREARRARRLRSRSARDRRHRRTVH